MIGVICAIVALIAVVVGVVAGVKSAAKRRHAVSDEQTDNELLQ